MDVQLKHYLIYLFSSPFYNGQHYIPVWMEIFIVLPFLLSQFHPRLRTRRVTWNYEETC